MKISAEEIALTFSEKFQKNYPRKPLYELMVELTLEIKKYAEQFESHRWIKYDWLELDSRPKTYDKYFVRRKDGKVHWETWNGSGWAYNEKVITHYAIITTPSE